MKTLERIQALFPVGTDVIATPWEPNEDFFGRVVNHRIDADGTPLFTVEDQNGACFDCEAHELEVDK